MIDMLLVYPKPTTDSPVNLTPLSILFPGAAFEQDGKAVAYFDERYDPPEMLDELIADAAEIGVSAFTGYQTGRAAAILKRAKEIKPSIVAGVGGKHAQILPAQVLAEPFVDKIWTMPHYGEDLFPFNARTKIHFQRTDMQYSTSRGCPFACSFCSLSEEWRPRDIGQLDRELSTIHDAVGFKAISFSDPNIAHGIYHEDGRRVVLDRAERIRQIGRILCRLGVWWDGNMRSPNLTPDVVEALVESNCYSLEIGCESGCDWFLKNVIRKGHGVDSIKRAVRAVKGSGISLMYSFMANMPRETPGMLMETLDLIDWIADEDPAARISIYSYAPYPGTPMYHEAVNGMDGYPKFIPPETMEGWGDLRLMRTPLYWIAGLSFRLDNTRKNFPGEDWAKIEPYVELAKRKWKARDLAEFPCEEVEELIASQQKGSAA